MSIYISQLMTDGQLRDLLRKTGAGLELVDPVMGSHLDRLNDTISDLQARLNAMGNPPVTVHGPYLDLNPASWDEQIAQVSYTRYEQAYLLAKELGAEKIVYHSCFVPAINFLEGWPERAVDFYNRFLSDKDDSIGVVMENVFDPSPYVLREVAQQVDHPAFGLCVDIGHAHCFSSVSVEEWLSVLLPWLRHIHIHDNMGDRDAHLALGKGSIPFKRIAPLIPSKVTITIECNTPEDVLTTWKTINNSCGNSMKK